MTAPRMRGAMRGAALGNVITLLLVVGLIGLGAWLIWGKPQGESAPALAALTSGGDAPSPIEPATGVPQLALPAAYAPKDNIVEVDISEYAGYSGLIVANGGLAPNPDSFFAKEYGFQVKLSLSEGENWSKLNNGRYAASATTTDVLAVLGRQFDVVVPAQIAYSRGADMVVIDQEIATVNQLKGKVLAASQFNESEFFIRYLAQEAGVPVRVLRDLSAQPGANELGLVFYEDAFIACDAYAHELAQSSPRLNGCVGWTPRTDEVIEASNGRAKMLVSNRNLLVVADVLAVNGGFARANPKMVQGLAHGLLEGNRRLRDEPERHLAVVAKAFNWSEADAREELKLVHFANLPENQAFFAGTIDAAGSFGGIYQSSVLAYGNLIKNPADADRFIDGAPLKALAASGRFAGQKMAIAPIRTTARQPLEGDALLAKDIRFFFQPNSALLDESAKQNADYLDTIKRFLQVSPGSVVLLRGHVDDARVREFREQGGDQLVRSMGLKAMELSKQRAKTVKEALLKRHTGLDPQRVEAVGRGWEEPAGPDSDLNRRVEVQWFTLE